MFDLDVFLATRPSPVAGPLADVMHECFGMMLIGAEPGWLSRICTSGLRAHHGATLCFLSHRPDEGPLTVALSTVSGGTSVCEAEATGRYRYSSRHLER